MCVHAVCVGGCVSRVCMLFGGVHAVCVGMPYVSSVCTPCLCVCRGVHAVFMCVYVLCVGVGVVQGVCMPCACRVCVVCVCVWGKVCTPCLCVVCVVFVCGVCGVWCVHVVFM